MLALDVMASTRVYVAIDVAKMTVALWLSRTTTQSSLPLALVALLIINAHRLAAVLVDAFERTPEMPNNGGEIVALHKRILVTLSVLVVTDIFVTYVVAEQLHEDTPPFALLCAILCVMQLGRLWRTLARYSIETFDRYASTTGLAQSRKHALVAAVDICFHCFQLTNAVASSALIAMFYYNADDYALRHDHTMLAFIVAQPGVQIVLDVAGVTRQLLSLRRRAVQLNALVDCLPSPHEKTIVDDVCVICRDGYASSMTVNDEKPNSTYPLTRTQLSCKHTFHRDCLALWLPWSLHCPICRTPCVSVQDDNRLKPAPLLSCFTLYS